MTDYNDGKWHGWNGGECPVHPQTQVEAVLFDSSNKDRPLDHFSRWPDKAGHISVECWRHGPAHRAVVAFRVVKPHTAPREWWIVGDCDGHIRECSASQPGAFLVREEQEMTRATPDDINRRGEGHYQPVRRRLTEAELREIFPPLAPQEPEPSPWPLFWLLAITAVAGAAIGYIAQTLWLGGM